MVLSPKRVHIGNSVIHPENGLMYAYYGTVASRDRAEVLTSKFQKERQWTFIHEVPGKGFSIFHRHSTLEHAKAPFGKVPPKAYIPIEKALLDAQAEKPRQHRQAEPGSIGIIVPKATREVLSEQEKRAKKVQRRAARRIKKQEEKTTKQVMAVMGQIRPDLRV
jgi:hypothetical protein